MLKSCPRQHRATAGRQTGGLLLLGILFALLPIRSVSAQAQASPSSASDVATVRGVTTTQAGSVFLPGVVVVLRDPSGAHHAMSTTSDDTGHFSLTSVPRGEWDAQASLAGFDVATKRFRAEPGKAIDVALDLPVAKVAESVTVVDRAPNAVPTSSGEAVSGSALTQAPLRGDNYQALLPLLPAVVRGSDGRMRMAGGEPTQ